MSTATLPLPTHTPIATPRVVAWTVETFHKANSYNVWGEGRRMLLIRGQLMEQGVMNPLHATAIDLVGDILRGVFTIGCRVRCQTPLVLGLDTDPIPDYAVIAGGARDFANTHPTTASLIVEISDSTMFFDLTTKAELYATANIAEYWVLDLENRGLIVHRDPVPVPENGNAYQTQMRFGPTDKVSPLALPSAIIAVSEMLP
jgi:Uma2 family endonuclease